MKAKWTELVFGGLIAILFLLLPFYQNGVFFEQGHVIVDIVSIVLFSLWFGTSILKRISHLQPRDKKKRSHDSSSNISSSGVHFTIYDASISLYIVLYALSLFYAADFTRAFRGALDALALLFPYWVFRQRLLKQMDGTIILGGLAVASMVVNVVGMGTAWHTFSFPSAFDPNLHQVASVFQYHNAYATFTAAVSAMLLTYLGYIGLTSRLAWFFAGAASLDMAGLWASGSRGALLFWVVMLFLILMGSRSDKKAKVGPRGVFLLYLYLTAFGFAAGYPLLHRGMWQANAAAGWLGVTVTFFLPAVLSLGLVLLQRKDVLRERVYKFITLPKLASVGVGAALVGAVVKSHALLTKLQSYQVDQLSVSQRFIFWEDALKIVARNPLTGSGGGAWSALYEKYQTYPYYTTRSHSFLMDTAMEVGTLGLIAFVVALWPTIRLVVWPKRVQLEVLKEGSNVAVAESNSAIHSLATSRALAVLGLALFAHSVMDWDMSFNYLRFLMTLGIGTAVGWHSLHSLQASAQTAQPKTRFRLTLPMPNQRSLTVALASLWIVALLVLAFVGIQLFRANKLVESARKVPLSENTLATLQKAHALAPYDAAIVASLASAEMSLVNTLHLAPDVSRSRGETALSHYVLAAHLAPFDSAIQGATATLAYQLGEFPVAFNHATRAFQDAPFYSSNVSLAIDAGTAYAMRQAVSQPSLSHQIFAQISDLYQQYLQRDAVVHALPSYLPPMSPYTLDPFTYDSLAATALGQGHPLQAIQLASTVQANPDAHTAQLAQLIILIAKQKAGQPVSAAQVNAYLAQHPSLQSSYNLLKNIAQ